MCSAKRRAQGQVPARQHDKGFPVNREQLWRFALLWVAAEPKK
jgi:hypothetical protein